MVVVDFVQARRVLSYLRADRDSRKFAGRAINVQSVPHYIVGGRRHERATLVRVQ